MKNSNTEKLLEQHGGNLSWIETHYPDAIKPLIDLSTGINPYGYPLPTIIPQWNQQLADSAVMEKAQSSAAKYYGAEQCVLASGMQPLMVALAALRLKEYSVSRIGIFSPTYGEHERVWRNMGHYCFHFDDIEHCNYDVVIVCNPNNPDGYQLGTEVLLALADSLAEREGWLIVDESFADLMPAQSMVEHVPAYPNLVVLRSCGKFFGTAGLRLSAAIGPELCIEWLRRMFGPWPISTAAAHVLPGMLQDKAWQEKTRLQLAQESQSWRTLLEKYFAIVGHTDLFTLVDVGNAEQWFHHLAARGILVRSFEYDERWLRFGLPDAQYLPRLATVFASGPKS